VDLGYLVLKFRNMRNKLFKIIKDSKESSKDIIFIIAPMLGMVGQASVAYFLQNALDKKYIPIIIGYCSPNVKKTKFSGVVFTLPWGSDYLIFRRLIYIFRIFKFIFLIWFLKPKFVICQGMTGIYFGIIGKFFHSRSKIIGSIHESANKYFDHSGFNKKDLFFLRQLDAIHYVSHGIKHQYEKSIIIPHNKTIYTPV